MRKRKESDMDNQKGKSYELGIVIFLALLFGIVLLNRLSIVYLFPFIINEFKISYAEAGALASILAITWAFSTWFFGGVSDRIGKKVILIPATIFFSLMSWASGITYSFLQMFLARGLMGIGQGATLPASIATISMESTPSRRGFNFGLHQALTSLIPLGVGAILVTQLTKIMSWRMVFVVVGIPGVIIAVILYFYMREPKPIQFQPGGEGLAGPAGQPGFFEPFKYRNVVVSSIVNFFGMCSLFVFVTFSLMYLTKELHLSISDGGIILSLVGFAGFFGCILLPLLSDYVGRKTVIVPSLFIMGLCFLGFLLSGANFSLLAVTISIAGFVIGGIGPLAVSALTTESVPPKLAATAAGIPVSVGEIFGSALMPFLAGYLSDIYGLKTALYFSVVPPFLAGVAAFFYNETAPKMISKKITRPPSV
jgi:predicted MFS family arabinose efflux permease